MEVSGQRRFAVMGENTFRIANKIMLDQEICRLLKYQTRDPFALEHNGKPQPDVDGSELINKQILITPKIFDDSTEKMSYIVAVFESFHTNIFNSDFKTDTIRFDIACPYDEWMLSKHSLRPYLLMQRIDTLFNGAKMAGIGTLQFQRANILALSPWLGGYSMWYKIEEFN